MEMVLFVFAFVGVGATAIGGLLAVSAGGIAYVFVVAGLGLSLSPTYILLDNVRTGQLTYREALGMAFGCNLLPAMLYGMLMNPQHTPGMPHVFGDVVYGEAALFSLLTVATVGLWLIEAAKVRTRHNMSK